MTQIQAIGQDAASPVSRFIALLYGVAAYVAFFVTILYAIGFVSGLAVPKTIDTGTVVPLAEALIVNLLLMSVFAVQHSVMARKQFKQWWTQFVSRSCCCFGNGVRYLRKSGTSTIRRSPRR